MYKRVAYRLGCLEPICLDLVSRNNGTFRQTHTHSKLKTSPWKGVVGLEIHAQIISESKLFSGAGTNFGAPVNTSVSLFDAAIPGLLPVLNRRCVEAGILTALALSCKINPVSHFDRKHYFYSDLPAGYQITQQRAPLAQFGKLEFQVFTPGVHKKPYTKTSSLHQLQLEQDSGKSLHDEEMRRSLIDLNRAGIPLMELVFEPDLENGEEAAALVKELSIILQRLGTCSCKMEEGAMRVDANISVHKKGEPMGIRTEVKNIGSIRAVAHATQYEIERQIKVLEKGGTITNETRSWDAQSKQTVSMRDKEEKQDYRFMPEPNLPPLHVLLDGPSDADCKDLVNVQALRETLPELPEETRCRLCQQYGISSESAIVLVNDDSLLQYFVTIMEHETRDAKLVSNFLIMDLLTIIHKAKTNLDECQVSPSSVGEIVDLLQNKRINLITAKKILQIILDGNTHSPTEIMELNGWAQIDDPEEIACICQEVLCNNVKVVEQYKSGKKKVFSALVGEVAKKTQQRANMAMVVDELTKQLKS